MLYEMTHKKAYIMVDIEIESYMQENLHSIFSSMGYYILD